jgi:hypothetical protein
MHAHTCMGVRTHVRVHACAHEDARTLNCTHMHTKTHAQADTPP